MKTEQYIYIEAPVLFAEGDPCGERYDLNNVDYANFLKNGFLTKECTASPKLMDVIGEPIDVIRDDEKISIKGKVINEDYIKLLENKALMGLALVGLIVEREGSFIKKLTIISAALVPANQLIDPRCICKIISKEQNDDE